MTGFIQEGFAWGLVNPYSPSCNSPDTNRVQWGEYGLYWIYYTRCIAVTWCCCRWFVDTVDMLSLIRCITGQMLLYCRCCCENWELIIMKGVRLSWHAESDSLYHWRSVIVLSMLLLSKLRADHNERSTCYWIYYSRCIAVTLMLLSISSLL